MRKTRSAKALVARQISSPAAAAPASVAHSVRTPCGPYGPGVVTGTWGPASGVAGFDGGTGGPHPAVGFEKLVTPSTDCSDVTVQGYPPMMRPRGLPLQFLPQHPLPQQLLTHRTPSASPRCVSEEPSARYRMAPAVPPQVAFGNQVRSGEPTAQTSGGIPRGTRGSPHASLSPASARSAASGLTPVPQHSGSHTTSLVAPVPMSSSAPAPQLTAVASDLVRRKTSASTASHVGTNGTVFRGSSAEARQPQVARLRQSEQASSGHFAQRALVQVPYKKCTEARTTRVKPEVRALLVPNPSTSSLTNGISLVSGASLTTEAPCDPVAVGGQQPMPRPRRRSSDAVCSSSQPTAQALFQGSCATRDHLQELRQKAAEGEGHLDQAKRCFQFIERKAEAAIRCDLAAQAEREAPAAAASLNGSGAAKVYSEMATQIPSPREEVEGLSFSCVIGEAASPSRCGDNWRNNAASGLHAGGSAGRGRTPGTGGIGDTYSSSLSASPFSAESSLLGVTPGQQPSLLREPSTFDSPVAAASSLSCGDLLPEETPTPSASQASRLLEDSPSGVVRSASVSDLSPPCSAVLCRTAPTPQHTAMEASATTPAAATPNASTPTPPAAPAAEGPAVAMDGESPSVRPKVERRRSGGPAGSPRATASTSGNQTSPLRRRGSPRAIGAGTFSNSPVESGADAKYTNMRSPIPHRGSPKVHVGGGQPSSADTRAGASPHKGPRSPPRGRQSR